jgi:hypothetical protein
MKHRVEYNYDDNCFHIATHNAPLALNGKWNTIAVFKSIEHAVSFVEWMDTNLYIFRFINKEQAIDHYRRMSFFHKDFIRKTE